MADVPGLYADRLYFVDAHLVAAAIIQASDAGRLMAAVLVFHRHRRRAADNWPEE